jgi:hypothetical protein
MAERLTDVAFERPTTENASGSGGEAALSAGAPMRRAASPQLDGLRAGAMVNSTSSWPWSVARRADQFYPIEVALKQKINKIW